MNLANTEPVALDVIETERFILRPVRRSDQGLLGLYAGDKRVAMHTRSIPHPMPPGATENFVTRAMAGSKDEHVWVLDGADFDLSEVLGVISLKQVTQTQFEIGYWVGPQFWGTGLARRAVRALVEANPLGAQTYFAEIFQDNTASARVITAAGFDYVGDAETFSIARGALVPTWTYSRPLEP